MDEYLPLTPAELDKLKEAIKLEPGNPGVHQIEIQIVLIRNPQVPLVVLGVTLCRFYLIHVTWELTGVDYWQFFRTLNAVVLIPYYQLVYHLTLILANSPHGNPDSSLW